MADLIPPRRNEFLTREGVPTQRFAEYLEAIANSTNSNTDGVDLLASLNVNGAALASIAKDIENLPALAEVKNNLVIADILKRISDLEVSFDFPVSSGLSEFSQKKRIVEVTANHTTKNSEVVICNNSAAITVTLNPSPNDGEQVSIKRRDASVTVSGAIDGGTILAIGMKYDAPTLLYTTSAGEWSII